MADTVWTAPTEELSASRVSQTTFPGTSAVCYHGTYGTYGQSSNALFMRVSRNSLISTSSPLTGMWLKLTRLEGHL
jgi:hypothetical protein